MYLRQCSCRRFINQVIFQTKIDYSQDWREKHKKTIHANYASSAYYDSYITDIFKIYTEKFETISELNRYSIRLICKLLAIKTGFIASHELGAQGNKGDKVIDICNRIGAKEYLSGPSAKNYIQESTFKNAGIVLEYKDYSGYPEYHQLWGDFNHFVSIIDVILSCGEKAPYYIWGWRDEG